MQLNLMYKTKSCPYIMLPPDCSGSTDKYGASKFVYVWPGEGGRKFAAKGLTSYRMI